MSIPWLKIVARHIPWGELVRRTPEILAASKELLNAHKGDQTQAAVDSMQDRIRALEELNAKQDRLMEQMAEQIQDLGTGLQVIAARLRLTLVLFVVAAAAVALRLLIL